jgi:hypothetical protein
MWVVGAVVVGVVVFGIAMGILRHRRMNPMDGLSVSQSWIVAQRTNTDNLE